MKFLHTGLLLVSDSLRCVLNRGGILGCAIGVHVVSCVMICSPAAIRCQNLDVNT